MNLYESIKNNLNENDINLVAEKLIQLWEELPKEAYTSAEYIKGLKEKFNLDVTSEELDQAWDIAANDVVEEPFIVSGIDFSEKATATKWLREKITEYGNTKYFNNTDQYILNQLIEKYGNTYFWH